MSDDDGHAARRAVLASIRAVGDPPPVTEPLSRVGVTELPPSALQLVKSAAEPWTWAAYRSTGSTPYTWEHRAGGHQLVDSVSVKLVHPDGRSAVAVWVSSNVERYQLPTEGMTKAAAKAAGVAEYTYRLNWSTPEAWRWRRHPATGYPVDIPRAVDITELRRSVADGAPRLRLVNAPAVPAEPARVVFAPRPSPWRAGPMSESNPDAWAPVPRRWSLVVDGDLFVPPDGRPWSVASARSVPGGIEIVATRGGETRRKVMLADETVPVLIPLAERHALRDLAAAGITGRILERRDVEQLEHRAAS